MIRQPLDTYSVRDFATGGMCPCPDTTDWYDVVMFDGQTIKVNAMAMPTLGIVANQAFQAIPYVINRNDASDRYGNAENATEKRKVFAGRSDVRSWGGSGVIETLNRLTCTEDPNNDGRAACRFLDRYHMARAVVLSGSTDIGTVRGVVLHIRTGADAIDFDVSREGGRETQM